MGFTVTPTAQIDFPDSSWSLSIVRDHGRAEVVFSLHWNGKPVPSHQVACSVAEFKMMIDAAGLV